MAWQASFDEAQCRCKEGKYFDGVQSINKCMELFAAEVEDADSKILKDPTVFVDEFLAKKMSPDQVTMAFKMFVCRGDLLTGLGADKRAVTEYSCAAKLQPDDGEFKAKFAKITEGLESSGKKPTTGAIA